MSLDKNDNQQEIEEAKSPAFEAWARFVIKFRWPLLFMTLSITAFMAYQIKTKLRVDTTMDAFIDKDNKANLALEEFREIFGRDDLFLIMIEGDVFSRPYLQKLEKLHHLLESFNIELESLKENKDKTHTSTISGFEGDSGWGEEEGGSIVDEIISLINARKTVSTGDGIKVSKLMEPLPSDEDLPKMKQEILNDRTLVGQVIGKAGRHSVIVIRTLKMSEEDSRITYEKLKEAIQPYYQEDFKITITGTPAMISSLHSLMMRDLRMLITVAVLMIVIVLFVSFRHPFGIIGPLGVVVQAAIWTLGGMAFLGSPMTMLTNIIPTFLICVGIGDSVHYLSIYRDYRKKGYNNYDAIVKSMSNTGTPIIYTSLTTMAGLASFKTATVDAIGDMGMAAAFGVGAALIITLILIPILLSFNTKSLLGVKEKVDKDIIDAFLNFCSKLSLRPKIKPGEKYPLFFGNPKNVTLSVAFGLFLLAIYFSTQLRVWHNPLIWLPKDNGIKVSFDVMDKEVGGTANVILMITPKGENGVKSLKLLQGMEQFENYVKQYKEPDTGLPLAGNITSVLDVVKESNKAFHGGDSQYYRLPDTERGVSDLLFLFESAGQEHLRRLVTSDFSKTQMNIRIKWMDATAYIPFSKYLEDGLQKHLADVAVVQPTGVVYNLLMTVGSLVYNMLMSFSLAFVIIWLMFIIMLKDIKLGSISMIPNLLPIAYIIGLMGLCNIPVDLGNILVASIAIGLAVDDTIHFMHHFSGHYKRYGNVDAAIKYTLDHSGRAMVSTSIVLCMGFLVYLTASMKNLVIFGTLTSITIVFALLFDLIFSPALLRTFYKDKNITR